MKKTNNLSKYHDFYIQSDTLLSADVFGNIRNMCLKIYELGSVRFLTVPRFAWHAALRKNLPRCSSICGS